MARRSVDRTQIGTVTDNERALEGGEKLVNPRKHAGMNEMENPAQIRWNWWYGVSQLYSQRKESYLNKR